MLWWTDELLTGEEVVDNQHKKIFSKASEIFQMDIQTDLNTIKKAFEFLMGYTNSHFYEEEQMMMKNNYVNFIEHRNQHNYLVEKLYTLYLDISDNGVSEELLSKLKILIIDWLSNHINVSDKEFISLYKNKDS